jgi:hypothetical protein
MRPLGSAPGRGTTTVYITINHYGAARACELGRPVRSCAARRCLSKRKYEFGALHRKNPGRDRKKCNLEVGRCAQRNWERGIGSRTALPSHG